MEISHFYTPMSYILTEHFLPPINTTSLLDIQSACNVESKAGIGLGTALVIGTYVTYIPQFYSIISAKDSQGLSFLTMFFLTFYNWICTLLAFMGEWNSTIGCCYQTSFLTCNILMLNIYLISANLICNVPIYIMMFYYYVPQNSSSKFSDRSYRINIAFLLLSVVLCAEVTLTAVIIGFLKGIGSKEVHIYSTILSVIAQLLTVTQWGPQIYYTFRLKRAGSLSIAMMVLQTPGAFIVVAFQWFLDHVNWKIWVPYFCNAIEMLILTVMLVFYELRHYINERRRKKLSTIHIDENQGLITKNINNIQYS